jgi:hypothetical protein
VIDYFVRQFVAGSNPCESRNCAAASGATAAYFGTRGSARMTAQEFRKASGVSCVPGKDSPSGGLTISAVERVCESKGVDIEYGRASGGYRRWSAQEIESRLSTYYGAVLLGMYRNVPAPWRAHGSTFQGGHSLWAHDLREDKPDTSAGKVQPTVCWHDPLRARPIRVPWLVVVRYTQSTSDLRGLAGFAKIPAITGGSYAKPMTDRTRTICPPTVAVHRNRTKGTGSTVRVIREDGVLVELAMYAPGESYKGERTWGALDLIGNEWINLGRLRHERGPT